MMSDYFIGLMSGTSLDGVDAIVADFSQAKPLVATHYQAMPESLKKRYLGVMQPAKVSLQEMAELDNAFGHWFADSVLQLLEKNHLSAKQITAIGSHGQNLWHAPDSHITWQIGDPNVIAAKTEIPVVADFRRKDLALGGQGAPLAPLFHAAMFADAQQERVILNIGGMANITVLKGCQSVIGFDTGPGNTLVDQWIYQHQQCEFDADGQWAASGEVHQGLLEQLLGDEYFAKPAPKSTGREKFNLPWLQQHLLAFADVAAVDVQRTLLELTAVSIANAIEQQCQQGMLLLCGGGAKNHFLRERLQTLLPEWPLCLTDQFNIPTDWVEALAFAWFAKQSWQQQALDFTPVTGSSRAHCLGGIFY